MPIAVKWSRNGRIIAERAPHPYGKLARSRGRITGQKMPTYRSPARRPASRLAQGAGGNSVGDRAARLWELAPRVAGPAAEPAVELADVEAALGQPLLQLVALVPRQHALVARPGLHQRPTAAQTI